MGNEIRIEKKKPYVWEIPREGPMRVPGRVWASDQMIDDIRSDESLKQVRNVACLPGIVGASLAMPDIHWGYGFPIGGVAATEAGSGAISPGGVGYDINCLSGDSAVLHDDGYTLTIREVVEGRRQAPVRCYDSDRQALEAGSVIAGRCTEPSAEVVEVRTTVGRRIVATTDHRFLTPRGMREIGTLSSGDRVAVSPFTGVPYENPGDEVLIDEDDVRDFLVRRGKTGGRTVEQVMRQLERRAILPLRRDSPILPTLIRVLGYAMGDGTLHFSGGTGKGVVALYGRAEDLESFGRRLAPWFRVSRVYHRRRRHRIATEYGVETFKATSEEIRVRSTAFAAILALLGYPVGNKTDQDYGVPAWLFSAPQWQQRLFLAAHFGAELQAPRIYRRRPRNFPCPVLTVQKSEACRESGRRFLEQIGSLAQGFGVKILGIEERPEGVERRHGTSRRLRLRFSSRPESLIALYGRIGFDGHRRRRFEAAVQAAYQRHKRAEKRHRARMMRRTKELRSSTGLGASKILSILSSEGGNVNLRFVERTLYGGDSREPRVGKDFETYPEFRRRVTEGLGPSGLVWEAIESIRPATGVRRVYDITVDHRDHNFVAEGFVVHNCGVRLARSEVEADSLGKDRLRTLMDGLFDAVPSGVGSEGAIRKLSASDQRTLLTEGARWAVEEGFGTPSDLDHTEEGGRLAGADPDAVSDRARERGLTQVGTLGSGNHFLEVQKVTKIYDASLGNAFGLFEGQVVVMIHSGSRGFGYQICDDYIKRIKPKLSQYGYDLPDVQLAAAPLDSDEGQAYLGAMRCAANYAWSNRQVMLHKTREAFQKVLGMGPGDLRMNLVYDVCHNIAKIETHRVDGAEREVCVHRKGATRAFPAGHDEIPSAYRATGQPVMIPGSMGNYSYVCAGLPGAMEETFGSTCHGAGRRMSRTQAKNKSKGRDLLKEMEAQGVIVRATGMRTVAEEMAHAYKDVADVVAVMEEAGISRRVARLVPLGVVKG